MRTKCFSRYMGKATLLVGLLVLLSGNGAILAAPMTPGVGTGESLEGFAAPSPHPDRSPPPIAPGNPELYHPHPGMGVPAPHRHRYPSTGKGERK